MISPLPYLKLLRLSQWLKNLLIYFPPFLGGVLLHPGIATRGVLPFLAFCMASSSTYIFNDILDRDNDRHHPDKKARPLPSGAISIVSASVFAVLLAFASGIVANSVSPVFLAYLIAYLILSLAYTSYFKNLALIDIFCISAGFLLRLCAGGASFDIRLSEWLFLTVFLLSIFLSTGKRLSEKNRLGATAVNHRRALVAYPDGFLQGAMYITGSAVLVTYTMYVITRHSFLLVYTVPLCCFGLLRFILRIQAGKSGDPTESLLKDLPLFCIGLIWLMMVGWGIYVQ